MIGPSTIRKDGRKMILSEKIVMLRKKLGLSQEEIAEKLGISRQSVSKWELGAAMPDLDKVLRLSQLFGVSTDYLLKDDAPDITYSDSHNDEPGTHYVSVEEANIYMNLVKSTSKRFANAISLLIISPIILILLSGYSAYKETLSENMAAGIGVSILLIMVACGVAVIVYNGMKLKKYEYLEKEIISLEYGIQGIVEKRKAEFEDKSRMSVTIGVALCIIGVVPLFIVGVLTGDDFMSICCVAVLLLFAAIGVNLFVRSEMINNSYSKLLQSDDFTVHNKKMNNNIASVGAIYWPTIVAIFLGYSFVTNNWQYSWIIWPVAGVLFAAIYGIVSYTNKK